MPDRLGQTLRLVCSVGEQQARLEGQAHQTSSTQGRDIQRLTVAGWAADLTAEQGICRVRCLGEPSLHSPALPHHWLASSCFRGSWEGSWRGRKRTSSGVTDRVCPCCVFRGVFVPTHNSRRLSTADVLATQVVHSGPVHTASSLFLAPRHLGRSVKPA